MDDKVYYFAYASNINHRRMHMGSPTAVFVSVAKLQDYEVVFQGADHAVWRGAMATVAPRAGSMVWGAVWEMGTRELDTLDKQERVHLGLMERLNVTVTKANGEDIQCFLYVQAEDTPRLPSPHYLKVIIEGAEEVQLPKEYIDGLRAIKHNGNKGDVHLSDDCVITC
jgi:gamma-glutamylcyclotransferase (GGCT)/AIG2-like uncharacterized protein YtfP